jgi:hypothetical protein
MHQRTAVKSSWLRELAAKRASEGLAKCPHSIVSCVFDPQVSGGSAGMGSTGALGPHEGSSRGILTTVYTAGSSTKFRHGMTMGMTCEFISRIRPTETRYCCKTCVYTAVHTSTRVATPGIVVTIQSAENFSPL